MEVELWTPEELPFVISLKLSLRFLNLHLSAFSHVVQTPCRQLQNYSTVTIQMLF